MRNTFNAGVVITTPYQITPLQGVIGQCCVRPTNMHVFPRNRYLGSTEVRFNEDTRVLFIDGQHCGMLPIGTKAAYLYPAYSE